MKYCFIIFIAILITNFSFSQTLRLVDQGGTPGSYPTISLAVAAANNGDTIKVLSGIYPESVVIPKRLYIIAQDTSTVVVSGANAFTFTNGSSGSLLYGFTLRGNVHHPRDFAQALPIIIANNRFINTYIDFMNYTIVSNNYFLKASNGYGITSYGSDSSYKRFIIFNNILDSCGIQIANNYVDVVSNTISNAGSGIRMFAHTNDFKLIANKISGSTLGINFGGHSACSNFIISNNLINNCSRGIHLDGGWWGDFVYTGSIYNNVITNSSFIAVSSDRWLNQSSSIYFFSNILSNNANNSGFHQSVWDYNCFYNSGNIPYPGSNNITSDPLFINPSNGDFRLQATSPCIDAGHPTLIYSDIDRTRNDMGIYGGSYTMSNYENLTNPMVIGIFTSPTQVIQGQDVIITGSGISK